MEKTEGTYLAYRKSKLNEKYLQSHELQRIRGGYAGNDMGEINA